MTKPKRRRIHVMAETDHIDRPDACAALRLIDRFTHPTVTETFDVSLATTLPTDPVDLIVLQRLACILGPNEAVERLVWHLKTTKTKLLYDIDDNLLDPHPNVATEQAIGAHRRSVRLLLRQADQVTVSTDLLRARFQRLNDKISVIPNALDERRLTVARMPDGGGDRFRIGYFGTFTHLRDLMSVVGPLRAALSRLSRRPSLVMCGISLDERIFSLFSDLADVEIIPPTGDYQSFLDKMFSYPRWDIGLAPLATGRFEAAKSDIKFLEYAAFGVPGLYAEHPAYATVSHGITGVVAAPDAWAQSLVALAESAEMRSSIVDASRDYLFSSRTLARSNKDLSDLIMQMMDGSS
jgi:glycosyltransferase involved in cell wall biosynthesis